MSPAIEILWWCMAIAGFCASAVFSGLETGVYSLNRVRLHLRSDLGHRSARLLYPMVRRPERILITLLVGNNIANNLATSSTGVLLQKAGWSTWQIVILDVIIVTPILFVFGETLPKDLFAAHADRLVYPFGRPLYALHRLFTWIGLLPLIALFSNVVMRVLGSKQRVQPFQPRLQVQTLVQQEGLGTGLLSDVQSEMIERVLTLNKRRLRDEMVPWSQVITIDADASPAAVWDLADEQSRSRYPLADKQGQVVGIVSVYDALRYTRQTCPPLRQLAKPAITMDADKPLRAALLDLRKAGVAMAIVTSQGKPVGIVTMKDLVEPITGELSSW